MKKVFAFILVLCLVSSAGAGIQISVNGDLNPIDSEITINVSDHLELDIWTNASIGPFSGFYFMLVCDTTMGDISGGQSLYPWEMVSGPTEDFPAVMPPPGEEGIWGFVGNVSPDVLPAGTVVIDSIDFHCVSVGDCVVSLYDCPDGAPPTILYDSVIIHQIPEPATMLLLGLGGLFLRRRR